MSTWTWLEAKDKSFEHQESCPPYKATYECHQKATCDKAFGVGICKTCNNLHLFKSKVGVLKKTMHRRGGYDWLCILSHLKLQSRLDQREMSLPYASTLDAKGIFGP